MSARPLVGTDAGADAGTGTGLEGEAFAEAHRELLSDRSIQFAFPELERSGPPPEKSGPPPELSSLPGAEILFWVIVAIVALFLLYLIAVRLDALPRFGSSKGAEDEPRWRPDEQGTRQLLVEADALAAAGDFSGAAHLLLYRTIEEIDERRPEALRPALTSRDIARLPVIPAGPREAFARIAMAVERSFFARRPLVRDDWSDCRRAYESFAFAEAWRG